MTVLDGALVVEDAFGEFFVWGALAFDVEVEVDGFAIDGGCGHFIEQVGEMVLEEVIE